MRTQSFREFLFEKKDHLIRKLKNLSSDEKEELIQFFNGRIDLESKIDWNNKDLTFDDFKPIMGASKTGKAKSFKLNGINALKKGTDYQELKYKDGGVKMYIPLNYEVSKLLASNKIGACEGKWCIAYQKTDSFWYKHIKDDKQVPVYLFTPSTKYAIMVDSNDKIDSIWDAEDKKIDANDMDAHDYKSIVSFINSSDVYSNYSDLIHSRPWLVAGIEDKTIKVGSDAKYGETDSNNALWKKGTWEKGTWESGVWEDGVWENGIWKSGKWQDGTWNDGIWQDGTWDGGTWVYGTWMNGNWNSGEWHSGFWWGGTWNDGTWLGGSWNGGTWKGGYDKDGNYHQKGDSPDKW